MLCIVSVSVSRPADYAGMSCDTSVRNNIFQVFEERSLLICIMLQETEFALCTSDFLTVQGWNIPAFAKVCNGGGNLANSFRGHKDAAQTETEFVQRQRLFNAGFADRARSEVIHEKNEMVF